MYLALIFISLGFFRGICEGSKFNHAEFQIRNKRATPPFFDGNCNARIIFVPKNDQEIEDPSIQCNPSGYPSEFSIKWLKNGQPFSGSLVPPSPNAVLEEEKSLKFVVTDDEKDFSFMFGTYQCIAENQHGKAYGQPVVVEERYVEYPEEPEEVEKTVHHDDYFCETCAAPRANPPIDIGWSRVDTRTERTVPMPIYAYNISRPNGDVDLCFSYLEKVNDSAPFVYQCKALNSGITLKEVQYTVEAPNPVHQPGGSMVEWVVDKNYNFTARVGDRIQAHACVFDGYLRNNKESEQYTNITYMYDPSLDNRVFTMGMVLTANYEHTRVVNSSTGRHSLASRNRTLMIDSATLNDTGTYFCDISYKVLLNLHRSTTKYRHSVRVEGIEMDNNTYDGGNYTTTGERIVLNCSAKGLPDQPTIRLKKNGITIAQRPPGLHTTLTANAPKNLRLALNGFVLENVGPNDTATYQCLAENSIEQRWTNYFLSVTPHMHRCPPFSVRQTRKDNGLTTINLQTSAEWHNAPINCSFGHYKAALNLHCPRHDNYTTVRNASGDTSACKYTVPAMCKRFVGREKRGFLSITREQFSTDHLWNVTFGPMVYNTGIHVKVSCVGLQKLDETQSAHVTTTHEMVCDTNAHGKAEWTNKMTSMMSSLVFHPPPLIPGPPRHKMRRFLRHRRELKSHEASSESVEEDTSETCKIW